MAAVKDGGLFLSGVGRRAYLVFGLIFWKSGLTKTTEQAMIEFVNQSCRVVPLVEEIRMHEDG